MAVWAGGHGRPGVTMGASGASAAVGGEGP